jgi:hypothetical protein
MYEEAFGRPYNQAMRGTMQPRPAKRPETDEERRRREHRQAVEDVKRAKAALNEAKERYARYDREFASEAQGSPVAAEDSKSATTEPRTD